MMVYQKHWLFPTTGPQFAQSRTIPKESSWSWSSEFESIAIFEERHKLMDFIDFIGVLYTIQNQKTYLSSDSHGVAIAIRVRIWSASLIPPPTNKYWAARVLQSFLYYNLYDTFLKIIILSHSLSPQPQ